MFGKIKDIVIGQSIAVRIFREVQIHLRKRATSII